MCGVWVSKLCCVPLVNSRPVPSSRHAKGPKAQIWAGVQPGQRSTSMAHHRKWPQPGADVLHLLSTHRRAFARGLATSNLISTLVTSYSRSHAPLCSDLSTSSTVSTCPPGAIASASCPETCKPADLSVEAVSCWKIWDFNSDGTGGGGVLVATLGPSWAAMELPRLEFVAIILFVGLLTWGWGDVGRSMVSPWAQEVNEP